MPRNDGGNVLVILLACAGISVGAAFMTVPYAERGSGQTPPPNPQCTDSNWSAGSAFFTIAALCFGFYAYPRGCLILVRSGRFWRLSPILAAEEMVVMLSLFTHAVWKGYKPVTVCYTLIAIRLYNGFYKTEVQEVLGLTMESPPVDDEFEVYRLMAEDNSLWVSHTQHLLSGSQSRNDNHLTTLAEGSNNSPRVGAQATNIMPASSTQNALNQISSQPIGASADSDVERNEMHRIHTRDSEMSIVRTDASLPEWRREPEAFRSRIDARKAFVAQRRLEYNRHLFERLFAYMEGLEAGPSYRIFVWAPMLLQVFKLVTIFFSSDKVSRVTFMIAWTYFFSWLVVELLMVTIAYNDLPPSGIEDAAQLGYEWRDILTMLSAEAKFQKSGVETAFVIPSLIIVTTMNIILTGKFAYGNGLPFVKQYWVAFLVMLLICFVSFLILCLCMTPICLWLLSGMVVIVLKITKLEKLIGKPWILRQPLDDASLYPASVALYGLILAVLGYTGTGPWKDSFPCWNMKKPSFYDWLG